MRFTRSRRMSHSNSHLQLPIQLTSAGPERPTTQHDSLSTLRTRFTSYSVSLTQFVASRAVSQVRSAPWSNAAVIAVSRCAFTSACRTQWTRVGGYGTNNKIRINHLWLFSSATQTTNKTTFIVVRGNMTTSAPTAHYCTPPKVPLGRTKPQCMYASRPRIQVCWIYTENLSYVVQRVLHTPTYLSRLRYLLCSENTEFSSQSTVINLCEIIILCCRPYNGRPVDICCKVGV